jgi:hypothetical protein
VRKEKAYEMRVVRVRVSPCKADKRASSHTAIPKTTFCLILGEKKKKNLKKYKKIYKN